MDSCCRSNRLIARNRCIATKIVDNNDRLSAANDEMLKRLPHWTTHKHKHPATMSLCSVLLLCLLLVESESRPRGKAPFNNVCKTFLDYYLDKDHNKNCYYEPDMFSDVVSIILFRF